MYVYIYIYIYPVVVREFYMIHKEHSGLAIPKRKSSHERNAPFHDSANPCLQSMSVCLSVCMYVKPLLREYQTIPGSPMSGNSRTACPL